MHKPLAVLRYFVLLLALCFATSAHADDRADARVHYQAGMKYYAGGDYRGAIREFSGRWASSRSRARKACGVCTALVNAGCETPSCRAARQMAS